MMSENEMADKNALLGQARRYASQEGNADRLRSMSKMEKLGFEFFRKTDREKEHKEEMRLG